VVVEDRVITLHDRGVGIAEAESLLRQPFPAIQPDPDLEGEPSLHPRIHPAEFRMDHVVIQHVTRTFTPHQEGVAVFKGGVQFRAADGAHQAFLNPPLTRHLAGHLVLVHLRGGQVKHGQVLATKRLRRGLLDPLAHRFDVLEIVLKQDVVLPTILFHGGGALGFHHLGQVLADVQPAERTGQNQPVPTADFSLNLVFVFCDKLLHGVLLM
jgi:hypothetical protein